MTVNLPSPVAIDALDGVELEALLDLADPIRQLYGRAFRELIRLGHQAARSENGNSQLRANLKAQRDTAATLERELAATRSRHDRWRELALPNAKEALLWTAGELLLGLLPFPLPTSPMNYFPQVRRTREFERNDALDTTAT